MSKVKGKCECPHRCHAIVHISALAVSTQASCHYPRKGHVIMHTNVRSISKDASRRYPDWCSRQASYLFKQASRHYPNKRRHYPNKRHVIIQTSFTSLYKQASRHYPNKRRLYPNKHSNPSIDPPHRGGTLGMNMYTHINYSQSVQEWIIVQV